MGEGEVISLIAGAGRFPVVVAEAIKARGHPLVCITVQGDGAELAPLADYHYRATFGEMQQIITILGTHGVRRVVLAGQTSRTQLIGGGDEKFHQWLAAAGDRRDHLVFLQGVRQLAQQGIEVASPLEFVGDLAVPPAVLTARRPSDAEWDDIRLGMTIARAMAGLDVGQTVVLTRGVILAVEAAEGTDETIRRGGAMAEGAVVTKAARPNQDDRFDLPTIGLQTVATLRAARASVLAVEAGRTLLLDRGPTIAAADAAGITILGVQLTTP